MSYFSSIVTRSTSVANTHARCIHVILDCNLCIHYNTRFVLFIMLNCYCTCKTLLLAALRIAHCRYLSYSEGDFKIFCPTGATCCTDGVKFGIEEWTEAKIRI